ncbi:Zn(II)2Cys6 transcription factor [Penicillium digitatum]|uniref:Zn(II)2Cys6 transcription factor n=1 Tax=Penicillium digitatum TaxID=36651 RepID=A0A7T7BHP3_PENDI|nr:Zn(II)2Cys6 transcription factor [Penicillium digitatum]
MRVHPKARRTANACVACRQSKIKCSGHEPCLNCQRREVRCHFAEGIAKVMVSKRYLQHLEAQIQNQPGSPKKNCSPLQSSMRRQNNRSVGGSLVTPDDSLRTAGDGSPPSRASYMRDIWTSPFSLPSTTIRNTKQNSRNWIWLAPSSMWSFTTRLTILMSEKLHHGYPRNAPTLEEK